MKGSAWVAGADTSNSVPLGACGVRGLECVC